MLSFVVAGQIPNQGLPQHTVRIYEHLFALNLLQHVFGPIGPQKERVWDATRATPVPNPCYSRANPFFWSGNMGFTRKHQVSQTRAEPVPNPLFTHANPFFFLRV